jgi:hypothetical protein
VQEPKARQRHGHKIQSVHRLACNLGITMRILLVYKANFGWLSMDATHLLLCVDVEDEKSVGRGEVRLIKELACTVSLSSWQPKESS